MRRPFAVAAAALALGGALPGCVAAVIPLAAGGVIGKRKLDRPQRKAPAPMAAAAMPASPRMTLLPVGTAPPPPSGMAVTPAPGPEAGWRALVRHVARAVLGGATCASGGTAVLIDADVAGVAPAERDVAITSLNALRAMNTSVTFVAADPAAARRALSDAGMTDFDTKIASPGEVIPIARRGCVVASGGGARTAYTGLAWFALPPRPVPQATVQIP